MRSTSSWLLKSLDANEFSRPTLSSFEFARACRSCRSQSEYRRIQSYCCFGITVLAKISRHLSKTSRLCPNQTDWLLPQPFTRERDHAIAFLLALTRASQRFFLRNEGAANCWRSTPRVFPAYTHSPSGRRLWSRSSTMSWTSSRPTESRIIPVETPFANCVPGTTFFRASISAAG